MCGGVTRGLAGMNFSGSLSAPGNNIANAKSPPIKIMKPTVSFVV